jgi:uncharacterized membrane protein/plastocyanin
MNIGVFVGQELFDWVLLLGRWLHITVAVTWIGTSIFFMWLDRTLEKNEESKREGHVGELWMVHGGGFYHVEKMLMGPTKVPEVLHWFKWEAYWTWLSGTFLVFAIFYTGGGTFLLDSTVSDLTYFQGVLLGIFSLLGSWVFYDTLWERKITREKPIVGHILTLGWFVGMSYLLCNLMSGRAAYIHIGGMLGTWMTLNVFMRIIPRQLKMVEASKTGQTVNKEWAINAKNRSTHNTYFTLPVIFIMLSNHFPATYGHEMNWFVLLLLSAAGAAIREYFVVRIKSPARAKKFAVLGVILIIFTTIFTSDSSSSSHTHEELVEDIMPTKKVISKDVIDDKSASGTNAAAVGIKESTSSISGKIFFDGQVPRGKKLRLPRACAKQHKGDVFSNEILVSKGMLQNVLVRISQGLEGRTFKDVPSEEVILDQKGCMYSPKVLGARVGQKVVFVNSDPVFHNVKSVTKKNKKFNVAMPKKNQRKTKVFTKPELFLQTKCSVHPWMGAYVAVMDHPFFSVTNKTGEFKINDLPHGNYTLEVWHETLGTQTKELKLNSDISDLKFTFKK